MNMPEVKCFLCVEDGNVLKLPPGDESLAAVRADPTRYVAVEAVPSRIQYQWLDAFIRTIEDDTLRARMEAAINGKGAFRRFKDILLTLPDERRRWFEFRDIEIRKRMVDWVTEQGVDADNEPDWNDSCLPAAPRPQSNTPTDVEALRDFLIEWVDQRTPNEPLGPLALEELAQAISESFRVRPL